MTAVLLDTHIVLWWFVAPAKLSREALETITDDTADVYVSVASAWEIATKVRLGKLPEAVILEAGFGEALDADNFMALPVAMKHGLLAGRLPGDHGDPFDRMLAAQSILEGLPIITRDPAIRKFGAKTIW